MEMKTKRNRSLKAFRRGFFKVPHSRPQAQALTLNNAPRPSASGNGTCTRRSKRRKSATSQSCGKNCKQTHKLHSLYFKKIECKEGMFLERMTEQSLASFRSPVTTTCSKRDIPSSTKLDQLLSGADDKALGTPTLIMPI